MITVSEAWRRILDNIPTMGTELIGLDDLCGRVLAEPIASPLDLPIFTNSAVDGYALRSADSGPGAPLKVVASVAAGTAQAIQLAQGEAVRLFTGSPVPDGADAVVMHEDVEVTGSDIVLSGPVQAGAHIRVQGEEAKKGTSIFEPQILITPPVLGVLATLGLPHANVYRQPRISIIGTGNELVTPGSDLKPAQIFESNTYAISAAMKEMGGVVVGIYNVGDEPMEMENALRNALSESDTVITCGGVSVGDHDVVRESAKALGVNEIFWRVAMRPGKPFFFGISPEGKPIFGLPGNPVSALVTAFILIRPGLRKMVGLMQSERWIYAKLGAPIKRPKGRADFVRATGELRPELVLIPTEGQGSHMLTGLANAEYLIHLPDFVGDFAEGDRVSATRLTWGFV